MTAFSPSSDFAARWLATPVNIRHTIYQELDDIKTLLQSDDDAGSFHFSVTELDASLTQMHAEHEAYLAKKNALTAQGLKELHSQLITHIDERLEEHLGELSRDIKAWLNDAINAKLTELGGADDSRSVSADLKHAKAPSSKS